MPEEKQEVKTSKRKNVLVTGGAGFIGSHLCDYLVKENNVICLDALVGGGDVENIRHLLANPYFRFIKHDITEPIPPLEEVPELSTWKIKFSGIQEIYHLACPTSVKNFDKLKIETLKANSLGIFNILELAKKYQAKIFFASSSVVYGPRLKDFPYFNEEYFGQVDTLNPRSCYDEGKRFAETCFKTYQEFYNLDIRIARIFRTYGPRQPLFDGQMIPDFFLQALTNKPLVIYGDENFSTSLCYVDDIIDGIIKLMNSSITDPINLGGQGEIKLVDLAKKIIELTGSSSKIEFRPPLPFMRPLGLPDISKARDELGWVPVTTLESGLNKMLEYTKARRLLLEPLVSKYDQQ